MVNITVNCDNATPAGIDNVKCKLGLYGGNPSFGMCARCSSRVFVSNPSAAILDPPIRLYANPNMPSPITPIVRPNTPLSGTGAAIWKDIHIFAYATQVVSTANLDSVVTFLSGIRKQLSSCGTCMANFDSYLLANPVIVGTNFFIWSINFHNSINTTLSKLVMTLENATTYWSTQG